MHHFQCPDQKTSPGTESKPLIRRHWLRWQVYAAHPAAATAAQGRRDALLAAPSVCTAAQARQISAVALHIQGIHKMTWRPGIFSGGGVRVGSKTLTDHRDVIEPWQNNPLIDIFYLLKEKMMAEFFFIFIF